MSPVTPPICAHRPEKPKAVTFTRAADILWESAWEALVLAFLIQVLGGIAVGIVSGICGEMTPSLPPILSGLAKPEAGPAPLWDWLRGIFHHHHFGIIFSLVWVAKSATRLLRHSPDEDRRKMADRLHRVLGRLSHDWFRLVVANAFIAFVTVLVIQITQQFSWSQLLWGLIVAALQPVFDALVNSLPGAGHGTFVRSWLDWYNENQFKFLFWLFYLGAICDDLGLPNYKALGRFLWRRWRARGRRCAKISAAP